MKFLTPAVVVAALLALTLTFIEPAKPHHAVAVVAAPILKLFGSGLAGGAGVGSSAVVVPAVGAGAAAVGIYLDVKHRTRCNLRRDTWVDGRNDLYPTHHEWRDLCVKRKVKRKAKRSDPPIKVRGSLDTGHDIHS